MYSGVIHDTKNFRIMGYDNPHAVKHSNKHKYAGQVLPYDHKHRHIADKDAPYELKDAYQLLRE